VTPGSRASQPFLQTIQSLLPAKTLREYGANTLGALALLALENAQPRLLLDHRPLDHGGLLDRRSLAFCQCTRRRSETLLADLFLCATFLQNAERIVRLSERRHRGNQLATGRIQLLRLLDQILVGMVQRRFVHSQLPFGLVDRRNQSCEPAFRVDALRLDGCALFHRARQLGRRRRVLRGELVRLPLQSSQLVAAPLGRRSRLVRSRLRPLQTLLRLDFPLTGVSAFPI